MQGQLQNNLYLLRRNTFHNIIKYVGFIAPGRAAGEEDLQIGVLRVYQLERPCISRATDVEQLNESLLAYLIGCQSTLYNTTVMAPLRFTEGN
jgi:hypothetical protein